jgi:hypothetical protein
MTNIKGYMYRVRAGSVITAATTTTNNKTFFTKKQRRPPNKKKKREKKALEELEDVPQRQYCPPENPRGDRNPECHEEQQKDVAWIHVAHLPKNAEKEHK